MFEFNNGVHLKDSAIWFDASKKKKLSFISNALSTKFLRHEKVITTPQTYKLLKSRFKSIDVLQCPYNHVFNLGEIEVELLPSGYIPGACQILLYKGNLKILYVADFKMDVLAMSTPLELTQCDILIIKSKFGIKKYIFQSVDIAIIPIIEFINDCLEREQLPVLVADRIGNSQELIRLIGDMGYNLYIHDSIHRINRLYEESGFLFPEYMILGKAGKTMSGVVIIPEEYRTDKILISLDNTVYASVSEISVDDNYDKSILNVSYCFPFSVRSGYDEMLKFVELVNPGEVYVTGNHNLEFSDKLRIRGYDSSALMSPRQLDLI